jgi:hypothetical protein
MAFSRLKTWVANEVLKSSDLNAEFDNVINNFTPTGMDDISQNVSAMQTSVDPGGIGTESLATNLAGEIQRLRYAIKRLVKRDGSKQWYEAPPLITSSDIATSGVATANIAPGAVTTTELADGSVTKVKQGPVTYAKTGNISLSLNNTQTTQTDVPSSTISITCVGKPVTLRLQSFPGTSGSLIVSNSGGGQCSGTVAFHAQLNAGTMNQIAEIPASNNVGGATSNSVVFPLSSFSYFLDGTVPGTYTFKVSMRCSATTNSSASMINAQFVVYEH